MKLFLVLFLMSSIGFATEITPIKDVEGSSRILKTYHPYIAFVLEVGKSTSFQKASELEKHYSVMVEKYPDSAARFLRMLRFEMEQKREFMGADRLSTENPKIRAWITRFVPIWEQEAEEYLMPTASSLSKK